MQSIEIHVSYAKTDELIPYVSNAKLHPDAQISKIAASIKEFGFINPIITDGSKSILAGHGRLLAAKKLGLENVPTIDAAHLNEAQKKAYILADNKLAESSWDEAILKVELENLMYEYHFDIALTGFSEEEIADLGITMDASIEAFDEDKADAVPVVDEMHIVITLGDLIELGGHRLMCGDSTNPDDVARLMGNVKADMIFTDPPYGVSYTGSNNPNGKAWEMISNDDLRGDVLYQFLLHAFKNMATFSKEDAAFYIFYASSTHIEFESAIKQAGMRVKQQLIWDKGMVLGHSDYHWSHEPILYCVKEHKNCAWHGNRAQKTFLNSQDFEVLKSLSKEELIQILEEFRENSSVWKIKKDASKFYVHPTQKPTELARRAMINSSKLGDNILEPFCGSGSTLIACESLNRKCYALEFSPKYAQTIIQRWCEYTGQDSIKINSKEYSWQAYKEKHAK